MKWTKNDKLSTQASIEFLRCSPLHYISSAQPTHSLQFPINIICEIWRGRVRDAVLLHTQVYRLSLQAFGKYLLFTLFLFSWSYEIEKCYIILRFIFLEEYSYNFWLIWVVFLLRTGPETLCRIIWWPGWKSRYRMERESEREKEREREREKEREREREKQIHMRR